MFIMSSQDQKMDALLKVMTELAKTMQRNSSYDGILGAARSMRGKKGGTEHKQRLPDEEFRIRNHFIDSLRHVQMQEVKERQKLAKRISEEEKRLSKTVRKHAKADSEASKNLRHLHRVVERFGDVLKKNDSVWRKHNDAIRSHVTDFRKQQAQYEKINDSFLKLASADIDANDLAKLKKTLSDVGNMLPKAEIDNINQRIEALSSALGTSGQDTIDKTFNKIITDLGTISSKQTKQLKDDLDLKVKDNLRLRSGLLKEEQQEFAMRKEKILNFFGTIDAIKKVEGDLTSGIGRFADMFGKDELVNQFAKDANESIVKFKDTLKALTTATDPKEIKKLDKIARAQSDRVFDGIRRFEERIAKLRGEQSNGFFKGLKENFNILLTKIGDGYANIKGDPGGTILSGVDSLLSDVASLVFKGVKYIGTQAKDVAMKEIMPDRLALMKYGTNLIDGTNKMSQWVENIKYAGVLGIKSTELAQMRAEKRALLLNSKGGEGDTLTNIGDIVHGITRDGKNAVKGTAMGQYFGGSSQDRIEASLAGLTMLRNSGIVTSFENLSKMMEQYTIQNQNITGLTQQQLFTYASDIMNMSESQELLSGATEEQQKAMLANTFKLQQVYAALGYSAEESKALTEELIKSRKNTSGKDKLKSLATLPMLGSLMGFSQNKINLLAEAGNVSAFGTTQQNMEFMQKTSFDGKRTNAELLKEMNTEIQKAKMGEGSGQVWQQMLLEGTAESLGSAFKFLEMMPSTAKSGVTKDMVANNKRMVDGTPGENKLIMSLDSTLTSFNNGLMHGANGAGMFVQAMNDLPKELSIGGENLVGAIKGFANAIRFTLETIGLGDLTRTVEQNKMLGEAMRGVDNLKAFNKKAEDSRVLMGYSQQSTTDRLNQLIGKGAGGAMYHYDSKQANEIAKMYFHYNHPDAELAKQLGLGSFSGDPLKKGTFSWNTKGMSASDKSKATTVMLEALKTNAVEMEAKAKQQQEEMKKTFQEALGDNTEATKDNTRALREEEPTKPQPKTKSETMLEDLARPAAVAAPTQTKSPAR